jgi:hypothetical protein
MPLEKVQSIAEVPYMAVAQSMEMSASARLGQRSS